METVIQMKDVSWVRNRKTILYDIDWTVRPGEHWAVLGLNGSGKTTLLNMVNGYIWPTTGKVGVLGEQFGRTDLRELRKRIGWVSSSLEMRVNGKEQVENIIVSGKYASIGLYEDPTEGDFDKVHEIMERLNILHTYNRPYETCSNGEKQKVLIGRALMAEPELLILDEPSNGLDFLAREEFLETLETLAESPKAPTLIFVTHHIEEVLPIFSHTLLLRKGTVYSRGETKEIFTNERLSDFFERQVAIDWRKNRAWMSLSENLNTR